MSSPPPGQRLRSHIHALRRAVEQGGGEPALLPEGQLRRIVGTLLEAEGCKAAIGAYCEVETIDGDWLETEVVGFASDHILLMPTGELRGVMPHARVRPIAKGSAVPVGEALLGRVIDGAGQPLDNRGPLRCSEHRALNAAPINPLLRRPIREPLDVGVRAINALLTVGQGQRLGLFAGSGVGKSVLLGMMSRYTEADVVVVALIGERGREVKDFIDNILGGGEMRHAVVIATPADHPPLMRMRAAWLASAVAEHFRDQGKQVLLLMDSLTRFAQAHREIALATGEPPATKGYPPSVFARLPALVERAGNGVEGGGSITAFYTVLAEGDDQNDPIVDAARAILDGHIVLSRSLADAGHFPAIDIERSVSRAMNDITDKAQQSLVRRLRQIIALYQQNRDLITIGAYQRGSDTRLDEAVALWPRIQAFLQQGYDESESYDQALDKLALLLSSDDAAEI